MHDTTNPQTPANTDPEKVMGLKPGALDLFKWVVTTVIIGGFTMWLGHIKDENDTKLKQMEVDSKLIEAVSGKFTNQADTNAMHQNESNYLKFISTFVTSEELISKVHVRLNYLSGIVITAKISQTDTAKTNSGVQAVKANPALAARLVHIANTVPATPQPMESFVKASSDALKGSKDSVILAKQPDKTIYNAIKETSINTAPSKIEDNYNLTGDPQTLWCKKGYYIVFNTILRIGINDIAASGQSVTVNFRDNNDSKVIPLNQSETTTLSLNAPVTLDYKDNRYQITLSYIGKAGLNPFTRAAYITVAVYAKGTANK